MMASTIGAEPHAATGEARRSRRLYVLNGASAKSASSHLSQWAEPPRATAPSGRCVATYAQRLLVQPARRRAARDRRWRRHVLNGCISTVGELTAQPVGVEPSGAIAPPGRCEANVCPTIAPAAGAEPRSCTLGSPLSALPPENGASAQSASSPPQPVGVEPSGVIAPLDGALPTSAPRSLLQPARSRTQLHVRDDALGAAR
jgi:hypothetical protein